MSCWFSLLLPIILKPLGWADGMPGGYVISGSLTVLGKTGKGQTNNVVINLADVSNLQKKFIDCLSKD